MNANFDSGIVHHASNITEEEIVGDSLLRDKYRAIIDELYEIHGDSFIIDATCHPEVAILELFMNAQVSHLFSPSTSSLHECRSPE